MNPNPLKLTLILIIAVLLTSCCGVVEEPVLPTNTQPPPPLTETSGPPTLTPLPPTETSGPPTPTLITEPIHFGEVTFGGDGCTVEGPEEISRGIYYFSLIDESDIRHKLWINQLLDEKTFNDLLDWQEEPGVYRKAPPWIDHPRYSFSFELEKIIHYLDQVGNYAILLHSENPSSLWFCGPFRVVEVKTE
jgi:hypothetical protein